MTSPRCPVKGCAIRYHSGPDRRCAQHAADAMSFDPRDLGIDLDAVPAKGKAAQDDPPEDTRQPT